MRIGLFVLCYVDAFHPELGIATLELLGRLGIEVEYPFDQTCCGQPMTNSGCHAESAATEALFVRNFPKFDYIVGPSGSCVHHVRYNLDAIRANRCGSQSQGEHVRARRVSARCTRGRCLSLGRVPAPHRLSQQLQRFARNWTLEHVGTTSRAVLKALGPLAQGARHGGGQDADQEQVHADGGVRVPHIHGERWHCD
jgi:hypothetical protein